MQCHCGGCWPEGPALQLQDAPHTCDADSRRRRAQALVLTRRHPWVNATRRQVPSLSGALMVVGAQGRIAYATGRLAEMLGYTATQLASMDLAALLPQPYSQLHARFLKVRRTPGCAGVHAPNQGAHTSLARAPTGVRRCISASPTFPPPAPTLAFPQNLADTPGVTSCRAGAIVEVVHKAGRRLPVTLAFATHEDNGEMQHVVKVGGRVQASHGQPSPRRGCRWDAAEVGCRKADVGTRPPKGRLAAAWRSVPAG